MQGLWELCFFLLGVFSFALIVMVMTHYLAIFLSKQNSSSGVSKSIFSDLRRGAKWIAIVSLVLALLGVFLNVLIVILRG